MAGVTPTEGENLILETIYNTNDLTVNLITNNGGTALTEASVLADRAIVTGGNYLPIDTTAGNWTVADGQASHVAIDFVCSGANYDLPVYAYTIETKVGTPTILHYEVITALPGGIPVVVGDTVRINLANILD